MKKVTTFLSVAVLLVGFVTACQPSKEKNEKSETSKSMDSTSNMQMAKVQYTCTMHPEVVTDAPGKCPKCGMDLVKKESSEEGMEHMHTDSTKHD